MKISGRVGVVRIHPISNDVFNPQYFVWTFVLKDDIVEVNKLMNVKKQNNAMLILYTASFPIHWCPHNTRS